MSVRRIILFASGTLLVLAVCAAVIFGAVTDSDPGKETFTLWQLPSVADDHGNSYVIRTPHGRVVAIDGGKGAETDYLRGFLAALGDEVDVWIVTHPHYDHVEAMTNLLRRPMDLRVHEVRESRFTPGMIASEPEYSRWAEEYYAALDAAQGVKVTECHTGDEFTVDGVHFKILSEINPEIGVNVYNNSSMAFRVWDDAKSVVFLGDLGIEGGDKLLDSPMREYLDCDYLQLAHHGQQGCSERFYRTVNFRACLWPTPSWLYNNDLGKGENTAHYTTFETRRWMEDKGVDEHYVACYGLCCIE